ncbi:MAG: hypothetical protein ACRDHJ_05480 [Actinomycetota bacterium]
MTLVRLGLKSLALAILVAVAWGTLWGATVACFSCGFQAGIIMVIMAFVGMLLVSAWVFLTSGGRIRIILGRIKGSSPKRMLVAGLVWGALYGVFTYLVQGSIRPALGVGLGTAVILFAVVPLFAWRLFASEIRL